MAEFESVESALDGLPAEQQKEVRRILYGVAGEQPTLAVPAVVAAQAEAGDFEVKVR